MPFMNSNYNNNAPQQNGEKKKTNFNFGRPINGTDGKLGVSMWVPDNGGAVVILMITAAVGKDPSTGRNVYEQKMPSDLPRFFLGRETLKALIEGVQGVDVNNLNVSLATGSGSKLTIMGQGGSVKIGIETQKQGARSITLEPVSIGNTQINSAFLNLIEYLKVGYRKCMFGKLDPEEFGSNILGSDANGEENDSTEAPF